LAGNAANPLSNGAHRQIDGAPFCFDMEDQMSRAHAKSLMSKILDNIIFLEEVFGEEADRDIPKIPVLEMARCFELEPSRNVRVSRRRSKGWPLWK
jgi:hypothetical protein